jgi:hypothetical protein
MSIENRLLRAIHARLTGDGDLMVLLGPDGVRDRVLPRMALLEVWAPGDVRRLAQEIAARARAALHLADLPLGEGAHLVSLFHTGSVSRSDVNTKLHVVAITFRAVTEVPA